MRRRITSINDLPIAETDRKFGWRVARRPDGPSRAQRGRASDAAPLSFPRARE
jgi:nuclear transport factor 2 (NTF2) superfamily protein